MKGSHLFLTLLSITITLAGVFFKNAERQRNIDRMNDPDYQRKIQEMTKLLYESDSSGVLSQFRIQVDVLRLRYDQRVVPRNLDEFLTPKMKYTDNTGTPLLLGVPNNVQVIQDENYKKVKNYLSDLSVEHSSLDSDSLLIEYTILTNARTLATMEIILKGNDESAKTMHKIPPFNSVVLISSFNRIEEIQPYTQIEYTDHMTKEVRFKRLGSWLKPVLKTSDVEILEIDR